MATGRHGRTLLAVAAVATVLTSHAVTAQQTALPRRTDAVPIDRLSVVSRHDVVSGGAQPAVDEVFGVGNGFMAFHAGATGTQAGNQTSGGKQGYPSFYGTYTAAEWAWHSAPNGPAFARFNWTLYEDEFTGRQVPFPVANGAGVGQWLYMYPMRLDLGQMALATLDRQQLASDAHHASGAAHGSLPNGTAASSAASAVVVPFDGVSRPSSAPQMLHLWEGRLESNVNLTGAECGGASSGVRVSTSTAAHPDADIVSIALQVDGAAARLATVRLAFAYPSPDLRDWGAPDDAHTTTVLSSSPGHVHLRRQVDTSRYDVKCRVVTSTGGGGGAAAAAEWSFVRDPAHRHVLFAAPPAATASAAAVPPSYQLNVTCLFAPVDASGSVAYGSYPPHVRQQPIVVARQAMAQQLLSAATQLPSSSDVEEASASAWADFWSSGAAVDLAGATTDPRAQELERRTVLSQYALRAMECGAFIPPEGGLVRNAAWRGKSHHEMRWFHQGAHAAFNRSELMQRSDPWYDAILPNATSYARFQGYGAAPDPALPAPARWPKQVGLLPSLDDPADDNAAWIGPVPSWIEPSSRMLYWPAPNPTGPLLLWQQPHVMWYAEQQRLAAATTSAAAEANVVERWADTVLATASFLAALPEQHNTTSATGTMPPHTWAEDTSSIADASHYHLDPPIRGGEEAGSNPLYSVDPTFEVAYTAWALNIASQWLQRLGKPPVPVLDTVSQAMAPLATAPLGRSKADLAAAAAAVESKVSAEGARGIREVLLSLDDPSAALVYQFNGNCTCTFAAHADPLSSCTASNSHPLFVGALGLIASPMVDAATMNRTVAATYALWQWYGGGVWGWDAGWVALALSRLGWSADAVVDLVLIPSRLNTFGVNGYNTAGPGSLAVYLPGNGMLLHSVAMMAAMGDAGFPAAWGARYEGFPPYVDAGSSEESAGAAGVVARSPAGAAADPASSNGGYSVSIVDRALGADGGAVISHVNGSSAFVDNFNGAWLPLPGVDNAGGGMFVRVTNTNADGAASGGGGGGGGGDESGIADGASGGPHRRVGSLGRGCTQTSPTSNQSHSQIAFVRASTRDSLTYEFVDADDLVVPVAPSLDPRATYRAATNTSYLTYQCNVAYEGDLLRKTFVAETTTPLDVSSWRDMPEPMFPGDGEDCGTCVWFPEDPVSGDAAGEAPESVPPAFALVTFGGLRGGNITLARSDDGLRTWRNAGVVLETRPTHWDNRTLSSGPCPVRLSDGNWLVLYNVDNKWPVVDPHPLPPYGRCALGWAVLDAHNVTNVLARSEAPLLYAQMPYDKVGTSPKSVYTDGVKAEGDDTFVVFAGGADSVVEAVRIKVVVPGRRHSGDGTGVGARDVPSQ